MATPILSIAAVLVVFILVIIGIIKANLFICPPNEVLIFSGRRRQTADGHQVGYRVIKGGRAFRIPLLEKVDRLDLRTIPIEVAITNAYSKGGIPLSIQGIANIKIAGDEPLLGNAVERFLQTPHQQVVDRSHRMRGGPDAFGEDPVCQNIQDNDDDQDHGQNPVNCKRNKDGKHKYHQVAEKLNGLPRNQLLDHPHVSHQTRHNIAGRSIGMKAHTQPQNKAIHVDANIGHHAVGNEDDVLGIRKLNGLGHNRRRHVRQNREEQEVPVSGLDHMVDEIAEYQRWHQRQPVEDDRAENRHNQGSTIAPQIRQYHTQRVLRFCHLVSRLLLSIITKHRS